MPTLDVCYFFRNARHLGNGISRVDQKSRISLILLGQSTEKTRFSFGVFSLKKQRTMQEIHPKILDKHAPQPPGKSENTRIASGHLAFLIAVDCQTVSKPYPKRIPTLSELAPTIQTLSKLYSNVIQTLSKAYPNPIQILSKPSSSFV